MNVRSALTLALFLSGFGPGPQASGPSLHAFKPPRLRAEGTSARQASLHSDLDRVFDDPVFSRALVGVRVESIDTGELVYARASNKLVMPASNMKLLSTP